jgi:hypothetical protein
MNLSSLLTLSLTMRKCFSLGLHFETIDFSCLRDRVSRHVLSVWWYILWNLDRSSEDESVVIDISQFRIVPIPLDIEFSSSFSIVYNSARALYLPLFFTDDRTFAFFDCHLQNAFPRDEQTKKIIFSNPVRWLTSTRHWQRIPSPEST